MGSAPAFVARAGRVLDVFIPFGGDLCEDAFRPPKFDRRSLRSLVAYPYWQRRGIVESRAVFADISPSYVEPALAKLGYKGKRVFASPPLPYAPLYTPEVLKAYTDRTYWYPLVRALRERTDVLVTLAFAPHLEGRELHELVEGHRQAHSRRGRGEEA